MKYCVDRIEDNLVVLENLENESIIEIDKKKLQDDIHEGSIVIYKDNEYYIDNEEEQKRKESIKNRFSNLIKK